MVYCESLKVGKRYAVIPAGVRDGGVMRLRGEVDYVTRRC